MLVSKHVCSECNTPVCHLPGLSGFLLPGFTVNKTGILLFPQGESISKDDDVFYDPDDEWEQDISVSSASSSFSRRR